LRDVVLAPCKDMYFAKYIFSFSVLVQSTNDPERCKSEITV